MPDTVTSACRFMWSVHRPMKIGTGRGPCNPKGLGEMPKRELSEAKHVVLDRALALDPTLLHRRCTPLGHSNRIGTGAPKGNFIFPPVHLKFLFEALAALLVCDQAAHLFEVARMVFRTKSGLRPDLRLRRWQ